MIQYNMHACSRPYFVKYSRRRGRISAAEPQLKITISYSLKYNVNKMLLTIGTTIFGILAYPH